MKKIIGVIALFGAVIILGGCGITKNNSTSSDVESGREAVGNSVEIVGFSFQPATLTVNKGEKVTWVNTDDVVHQIGFAAFNSEILNEGDSFSFTFPNVGTFDYNCPLHPAMTGKIIVK